VQCTLSILHSTLIFDFCGDLRTIFYCPYPSILYSIDQSFYLTSIQKLFYFVVNFALFESCFVFKTVSKQFLSGQTMEQKSEVKSYMHTEQYYSM